jgi:hypothetical protein
MLDKLVFMVCVNDFPFVACDWPGQEVGISCSIISFSI